MFANIVFLLLAIYANAAPGNSNEDVIITATSSNRLRGGAVNSAWHFIISPGDATDKDVDGERVMDTSTCISSHCDHPVYHWCTVSGCCDGCGSGAKCLRNWTCSP